MTLIKYKILFLSIVLSVLGCKKDRNDTTYEKVNQLITGVQQKYAPDKRTARFEVSISRNNGQFIVKGITTNPKAKADFKKYLDSIEVSFVDSIRVLPVEGFKNKTGIINNSVANIRSTKGDASEMASQALLGTPIKILQQIGGWYMVQTPDDYIGWIFQSEFVLKDQAEFENWLTKPKLIFTDMYGMAFKDVETKQPVSDLVAGTILALDGENSDFYQITYPDNRRGFVAKSQAQPYEKWLKNLEATTNSLVETSKQFLGAPYLWGGTSTKGVDCSGFTKSVYLLNGMILPRDASQQVHTGVLIDDQKDFSKLQPGDLLFFGRITPEGKEKVVHVGMWIGNHEFIHASGRVRIGSMDKNASNYDDYNYNRYLRTKRIFGEQSGGIQYLESRFLYSKP